MSNGERGQRDAQKAATRGRLLRSARRTFARHGFDATSVAVLCRDARVTHGALYHHFASKTDLFAAVLEALSEELAADVVRATEAHEGFARVLAACDAYLDACTDPVVQAIVFRDGPRVLAGGAFEAIDHGANAPVVTRLVATFIADGLMRPLPEALVARALGGAFAEAGAAITEADDRIRARAEAGAVIRALLEGLRPPSAEAPAAAHDVLAILFDALAAFTPTLVGSAPVGLVGPRSDLDVACSAADLDVFEARLHACLEGRAEVTSQRLAFVPEASVSTVRAAGRTIEIFCQPLPVTAQVGFRHMAIEARLLVLGGEALRDAVRAHKPRCASTEHAFAEVLGLAGDPFVSMLDLETWSDAGLTDLVRTRLARRGIPPT